jgi:hypothetical protein
MGIRAKLVSRHRLGAPPWGPAIVSFIVFMFFVRCVIFVIAILAVEILSVPGFFSF